MDRPLKPAASSTVAARANSTVTRHPKTCANVARFESVGFGT
ncbi:hypothetical protein [Singulisphaera sp. GP187]|nr:hypothetical protein [Singulisphaera sp. GP187]